MVNFKNIKIDIVYTWVNGNDSEWKSKKEFYFKQEHPEEIVNSEGRFIDNDELKYALRSLEKYVPWINKVFIVTDNQVPSWLNLENSKVKIVDHKEIMPNECLPSFNSNAIEHCISNIPDLSEYFLYSNDDFFFVDNVTPSFFYKSDGYPYFRFSSKYDRNSTFYSKMCANTVDVFEKRFGHTVRMFNHHNVNAFRKSDVKACIKTFKPEFDATISSRFRNIDNIEQTIYAYYGLAVKHGHYKGMCRLDMHLPIYKNKTYNYFSKRYKPDTIYFNLQEKDRLENFKINKMGAKLFCINDGEGISNRERIFVKDYLNELFPEKSGFEK